MWCFPCSLASRIEWWHIVKLSIARTRATQFISSILIASSALLLTTCGGGGAPNIRIPAISAELTSFPTGSIPAGFNNSATVSVLDGVYGIPILDAAVSMNGVALTYQASNKQSVVPSGDYVGNVVVAPGGVVTLSVTVDGKTYAVAATQHSTYPSVLAPAPGATWTPNTNNTVTWSGGAPTGNDSYVVGILDAAYPNPHWSYNWLLDHGVPIGTTSYTIPAYSLAGGSRYVLAGIRTTYAIPNAAYGSSLTIGGFNYVPVTVTGMPITVRMSGDATTPALNGIAWSGTQFVAVGGNGTIFTSPDGMLWTLRTSGLSLNIGNGYSLNGIAWSGTKFVAVGGGISGVIITSSDGITWTLRTEGMTEPEPLSDVTWSGSQFVAVGLGTIRTSNDGITWTTQTPGIGYYTLHAVIWTGTQFVVAGENGIILTSPDGISWTSCISGTTDSLLDVTWSGTQFVAVGGNGTTRSATMLTSSDGIVWTPLPPPTSSVSSDFLYGVTWAGTQFVAVGSWGTIFTSPDGATWTQQVSTTNFLYDVAWSGTRLVAIGSSETILTSP